MQLTKHFSRAEMACKCGCGECDMSGSFMEVLQEIRDMCGFPLTITSGYRCSNHNKKVGGAKNSRHVVGDAADISFDGLNKLQIERLRKLIEGCPDINGIGYGSNFIHIDTRLGKRVTWTY